MKKRLITMITLGIKQLKDPYYQGFAGQMSFYIILSLVPTLLLISKIFTFIFRKNLEEAVGFIIEYLNDTSMTEQVEELLLATGGGTLDVVFVLIAIWAASRAYFSLTRIANHIYSEGVTTGHGFFKDRLIAMKSMALTIVTIIFAIFVLMYGNKILEIIFAVIGQESVSTKVWTTMRWPLAAALYFIMISYMYYKLPSLYNPKFKEVVPGSIFASLGLLAVTFIYSFYVDRFADYSVMYGSLATVVSLLFWFYFLAWVLFLGILVNKVWKDTENIK